MRVEPDRQGHSSSEAPACPHCRVPLLAEATFCPYCERWLDETRERFHRRRRSTGETSLGAGILARITERSLLTAGFVFFAAVALVCVAVALLI